MIRIRNIEDECWIRFRIENIAVLKLPEGTEYDWNLVGTNLALASSYNNLFLFLQASFQCLCFYAWMLRFQIFAGREIPRIFPVNMLPAFWFSFLGRRERLEGGGGRRADDEVGGWPDGRYHIMHQGGWGRGGAPHFPDLESACSSDIPECFWMDLAVGESQRIYKWTSKAYSILIKGVYHESTRKDCLLSTRLGLTPVNVCKMGRETCSALTNFLSERATTCSIH